MPPWLESHADLRDHPKLDLLMELLAVTRRDACGLLHFVWWRTLTYAPSGDLSDFTDGQIARWADWDGDPGHLVSALKTAGFLDASRQIHDWEDFAGRWIDRRNADADRKREARKAAAGRANGAAAPDVRGASPGHPARVRTPARAHEPDLTGPDLTGPDRTSTSPGPSASGGERRSAAGISSASQTTSPTKGADLTPLSDDDAALWARARAEATMGMIAPNAERIEKLEPVGRARTGGLCLRAPPDLGPMQRFLGAVRAALVGAGDAHGGQATIVTT